jgi:hypothetical protein
MVAQMKHVLLDGVSLVAIDPAASHKIVGFRTASVINKLEHFYQTRATTL